LVIALLLTVTVQLLLIKGTIVFLTRQNAQLSEQLLELSSSSRVAERQIRRQKELLAQAVFSARSNIAELAQLRSAVSSFRTSTSATVPPQPDSPQLEGGVQPFSLEQELDRCQAGLQAVQSELERMVRQVEADPNSPTLQTGLTELKRKGEEADRTIKSLNLRLQQELLDSQVLNQ
jgi:hypothetical protein